MAKAAPTILWPINNDGHPLHRLDAMRASCEYSQAPQESLALLQNLAAGVGSDAKTLLSEDADSLEGCELQEFLAACFRRPQVYRDMALQYGRVRPLETFEGDSTFYVWLNKLCPVGCDFCFFQSGPLDKGRSNRTDITSDGIQRLLQYLRDGNFGKLIITGGGEPMMKKCEVNELVAKADVARVVIVTSSYFSNNIKGANCVIDELVASAESNPRRPQLVIRLSLDHDHLERLAKDNGFQYVHNLIAALARYKNHPQIKFLIHTVEGDSTVNQLLLELDIIDEVDYGRKMSASTISKDLHTVTLRNGFSFDIERSNLFASDTEVDLTESGGPADHNIAEFRNFLECRRTGNMSIAFHRTGPKGLYQLLLYDGTIFNWGATAPDVEPSLYEHTHAQAHAMNLNDPLTLGILEKGTLHRDDIVGEVNSTAVRRAGGVGLRDFHARLLLEEDTTRLYATIRYLQIYIAERRISAEEMADWPPQLLAMVKARPEQLIEACRRSGRTIVHQYLEDPGLTVDSLMLLYSRLQLGHYDVSQDEMVTLVRDSAIDYGVKSDFLRKIS